MIDEKKLIEDIEKEFDGVCVYDVSPSQAVNDFVEIVDRQPKVGQWIPCSERLPEAGENIILTFKDTFHTHPTMANKIRVMPAWRCNVCEEETPDGAWAIEGRLGKFAVDITDGIAWMPLPPAFKESED